MGFFGKIKERVDKATDPSVIKDKLQGIAKALEEMGPVLEKGGYRMQNLSVGISLPPSISLVFARLEGVGASLDEALKAVEGDAFKTSVVKALQMANKLQDGMANLRFAIDTVEMEMSIPPSVNIVLKPTAKPAVRVVSGG